MNLIDLSKNQTAMIQKLSGAPELVLRLAELGFTHGESVRLVGKSVFRSPLYVEIRGAVMALRKNEAACIQVKI